jgi:hypothetical protein
MKIALTVNLNERETLAVLHKADPGRTLGRKDRRAAAVELLRSRMALSLDDVVRDYFEHRKGELQKQLNALETEINENG